MYDRGSIGVPKPRHPISFRSYRKRIFCKPCNAHFGQLEERAIQLLVPMATGQTLSVDADGRELLSLWASKTAMAIVASLGMSDSLPQDHRDAVRHEGKPPPNCWVAYFRWRDGPNMAGGDYNVSVTGPNEPFRAVGYRAVLTFRELGFAVVGLAEAPPAGYSTGSGSYPVSQLWPDPLRTLDWPPPDEGADATAIPGIEAFVPFVPVS